MGNISDSKRTRHYTEKIIMIFIHFVPICVGLHESCVCNIVQAGPVSVSIPILSCRNKSLHGCMSAAKVGSGRRFPLHFIYYYIDIFGASGDISQSGEVGPAEVKNNKITSMQSMAASR